ncbi:hypothetical protein NCPPB3923_21750, partial [Burkholderia glumae]
MKKSVRTTSHLKLASFLLAACASFAQAQTPSPSTPATGAASENINQLIVKLKPAAAAARGSTSITTAAADIHGVIDRV